MSWPLVKLGDLCSTTQGVQITKAMTSDTPYVGSCRYLYIADFISDKKLSFVDDTFDQKKVTENDLVMANTGSPGRVFKGKGGILSNNLFKISFDAKVVDRDYLYLFLSSDIFQGLLQQQMKGGIQKHLGHQTIARQEIPLPPLTEQKRIAAILDKADAIRRKRQQAIQLADEFLRSVFLEMFGDPVTNPKGWTTAKFSEVGTLDRGKSKHRPRNDPALLGGIYPLIQTGDVANSKGYIKNYRSSYSELGLQQSRMWPAGTLCITIAANIAKTGILTFDACFPDSVVGYTPNERTTVEYVQQWLGFLQKTLEASAPESAQKNINLAILRDLDIPLPDIDLQWKFSDVIKKVVKLLEKLDSSVLKHNNLFFAVSRKAFAGKL